MTSQQAILLPRPPKCCATTLQDTSPFHMTSASEHSQKTPRFLRVALCLYTLYSDKSRTMQTKSSQTSPVPNSTLDSRLVCQTPKCHCSSCSSPSQTATPSTGPAGLSTQQPPCLAKVLWWLPTAFRNPQVRTTARQ